MLNIDLLLCGRQKFSVSTNVSSGGSVSVSPQGKQYAGTLMTVTCSPNSAYQFSSISIVKQDGTTVSYTTVTSGSRYTFIMPSSNVTVNVNYSLIPTYSISLSASGGSVRANKTSGIRAGETITLTMTPNAYYVLSSISTNPNVALSGSGNTRTFTMPSSNVTVSATFGKNYNFAVQVDSYNGYQYGKYLGAGAILENSTGWDIQVFATNHRDSPVITEFRSYSSGVPSTLTLCRLDTNFTMTFSKSNSQKTEGAFFQTSDVGKTLYIKIM